MHRFILKLANRLGYYSAPQVRSATGYAAAKVTRLTNSWTTNTLSADSTARNDLENLRARARQLAQDNPYTVKFLSMLKTNILGDAGMILKNQARDNSRVVAGVEQQGPLDVFANKMVQQAWKEWGKRENCTVARNLTWQQVNEVCLESAARDGEMFAQIIRWNGNPFGFALRLFESDHVDVELNKKLENGNEIRMGIELNSWGEAVRYWIRRHHPNDSYYGGTVMHRYEPIEAADIVHPFLARRLHQTRGLPWIAPAMERLNMLGAYEESTLVASRVNASSHGFFKRTGGGGYSGPDDGLGNKRMDMEPGQWEELEEGLEPHVVDLGHPDSNFDAFERRQLQGIAAGMLTSYNVLAEDMASVNFSSMRMGLLEPREVYRMLQCWWAGGFCTPIFEPWLDMQLTSGMVPLPHAKFDKFNKPKWKGRRWPYIEPNKDADAAIKRMDANLSSLTMELSERGIERDELLDEIQEDKAALEARGLTVAEVMGGGGAPPAAKEEEEPEEVDGDHEETETAATGRSSDDLKKVADAYGVMVRAGAITPTEADEEFFRSELGMRVTPAVGQAWVDDKGTRRPITITPLEGGAPQSPGSTDNEPGENDHED